MVSGKEHTLLNRGSLSSSLLLITIFLLFCAGLSHAASFPGHEKVADPAVIDHISGGGLQDLIVVLDQTAAVKQASGMRAASGSVHDTADILRAKAAIYRTMKLDALAGMTSQEIETLKDYKHLPAVFVKVKSLAGLQKLAGQAAIKGIYPNLQRRHFLTESLPLINQPAAQAAGYTGAGTSVAVLDTGLFYPDAAFGTCTGGSTPGDCLSLPSVPAGCRVACVHDFAPDDGSPDDDGHGTNVSAIVAGVAPGTNIIGLDVFDGALAYDSDIFNAIDWVIANKAFYNITAVNMSLGAGFSTTPCPWDPFAVPVGEARAAGILSAVASGNDGETAAISSPACVPAAVSVGAVYDSNMGGINWGICSDASTAADQITCFSNNAYYLTLLAPGSEITAGGWIMSGTSQATPHVAGAIAVLRGTNAFPAESVDETVNRLVNTGKLVTDSRDPLFPIVKPRINLIAALGVSISGKVTDYTGDPVEGVTINLTLGGINVGSALTDADGYYAFSNLEDGTYTVTPSKPPIEFSPVDRTVVISSSYASGVNFIAQVYSISGVIKTSKGTLLENVAVTLDGPTPVVVMTDAEGVYLASELIAGTYTVTPLLAGYTFSPVNRRVNLNSGDVADADFTALTYSISGFVKTAANLPLSGVTIDLAGDKTGSTTTAADGSYLFEDLPIGAYTVTPTLVGYSFSPSFKDLNIIDRDLTNVNFIRALTIYGVVLTKGGQPVEGVTVTLSGAASSTAETDSSGYYEFTGLLAGAYTVTPAKFSFVFTPAAKSVTLKNKDSRINFKVRTYMIQGVIKTAAGQRLAGIPVTVTGCDIGWIATTDSSGKYKVPDLPNCNYAVIPDQSSGYTFTPLSRAVTVNNTNVSGVDFSSP